MFTLERFHCTSMLSFKIRNNNAVEKRQVSWAPECTYVIFKLPNIKKASNTKLAKLGIKVARANFVYK